MYDDVSRWSPGGRAILGFTFAAGLLVAPAVARAEQAAPVAAAPAADARVAAVRQAAADYAARFNDRDFAALAAQWTDTAELVEGEGRLVGRENIARSIKAWLERHPQAKLEIRIDGVEFPAATLARVGGRMSFTGKPGAKPVVSRFVSLRVLEDGVWRIAESVVRPTQAAVLEELEWLVGTWKTEAGRGDEVEASFSRPLGDSCIVGRTTIKSQTGGSREVLQVIHADRASGQVKTWIFDSTGARAEGVVEPDGASYHQSVVGTPAETAVGNLVRWVQVISPSGDGRFTLHAIERSVDGVPVPDGPPLHFRKVR
jgi:uncharacterized protein (TIGR02246 family)